MNSHPENTESSSWTEQVTDLTAKDYNAYVSEKYDIFRTTKPKQFVYKDIIGGIRECAMKVREDHPELRLLRIEEI